MAWSWQLVAEDETSLGFTRDFDSRSDAETWIGVEFEALREDGVVSANLFDGTREVYGPLELTLDP